MQTLASVIISSHNYARFVAAAIDSALAQTYPRTEVVVVDDGSTDDSPAVVSRYRDRARIVLKENGGQASALNAGFGVSRGDVVLFMDSDDLLMPDAVEAAVRTLDGGDASKVHWPMSAIDAEGRATGQLVPREPLSSGDLRDAVLRSGPRSEAYRWPPTSGNAWWRAYLDAVMPIPEDVYTTCPDLYLASHAPLYGRVELIAEPKSCWRIHGQNNTWRTAWAVRVGQQQTMWERCFTSLARHARARGLVPDPDRWVEQSWWRRLARVASELDSLIPAGHRFILVDDGQWDTGEILHGRAAVPFVERDGVYWGPPADDDAAVAELERLRAAGATFVVFGWPAFWWLEHYTGLKKWLESRFRRAFSSDLMVVFDLRERT
jgi:hypothetical protein